MILEIVLDTTFIFALLVFAVALMLIGIQTRVGLLNIITLPIFLWLAIELQAHILLVFTMIALMFFNIYWVFRTGGQ